MDSKGFITRDLAPVLARAARSYPVVTVTGPRQSGKSTLCWQTFGDEKPLVSLEPIDTREFANSDPRGFLEQYRDGAILDEIQRAPDLLSYLQSEVDRRPEPGRFILTGSENLALSERVSQSLAGRNRTLFLLPPSYSELQRFGSPPQDLWKTIWTGAYPRIHHEDPSREPYEPQVWLADYIRDYLERDVRQVSRVIDLQAFRKLLVLAAGRTAQELNYSALGADVGVSHATARGWVSVLETSFVCFQLPAWHRNVRKQQVKSPKLHFFDTGLLCALLGIRSSEQLRAYPWFGAIFETWVASEVLKARLHRGLGRDIFHYRETHGLEVDLVVSAKELFLVEVKSSATVVNEFLRPLRQLKEVLERSEDRSRATHPVLVYGGAEPQRRSDLTVVPWREIQSIPWAATDNQLDEAEQVTEPNDAERRKQSLVERLFRHFGPGGRFHGRYELPDARSLERLPHQRNTWHLPIFAVGTASAHLLRVYELDEDPEGLLSAHWRNETRALHRLSTSGHPAIPRLHDSGRLSTEDGAALGFLVLEDTGRPIVAGHPLLIEWRRRPDRAFQAFVMLVEAVALLHEEGILHRTLTPLATRAPLDPDAAIMLDDFQLSTFAATWLQPGDSEQETSMLGGSTTTWACLAPERLEALLGTQRGFESFASDVFALGMIGLAWLVEPFEQWETASLVASGRYDPTEHHTLLQRLEERAHAAALPRALRHLLVSMVTFEVTERPTNAREVYDQLCGMYGAVLTALERRSSQPITLQLHYLIESVARLYTDGRALTPPEAHDHNEYAAIIAEDLADGLLAWSPPGPLPWIRERDPERETRMKTARIVLMGERYSYFCQYLHHGRPEEDHRVLVIKYMVAAHQTRELHRHPRLRPLPGVEPRLFEPKATHQRPIPEGTLSWEPLVISTMFEERHEQAVPLIKASRWLLSVQRAELALQEYSVERVPSPEGLPMLRQSERGDAFDDDSEISAFVRLRMTRRPRQGMGTLFEELSTRALEEDRVQSFELRTSRKERYAERFHLERRIDEHTVLLRERGDLPARGFLRPDDTGSRYVQSRQAVALEAVEKRHAYLAAQLAAPTAVELPPERPCELEHLDEPTRELVRRIVSSWPLFILQGPPGTGKTFVARHVVRAILEQDPYARILIAAQSHHALDNLLEGVDAEISKEHIRLRGSTPRNEHKLSAVATLNTLGGAVKRVLEQVDATASREQVTPMSAIAERWRKHPHKEIDLAQRIQRSASVMFSTCTAATSRALGIDAGGGFDWVIVEEAARAWITELLMPMLHGTRWLLIGDHRQLPAFQAREIRQLLARDAAEQLTAGATGIEVDRDWDRFLKHFEHLMNAPAAPFGFDPRQTLSMQRRMHPDIGTMVSRTFYDGLLQSHPETNRPHGLRAPAFVEGTALVWVDTAGYGKAAWERGAPRGGYENECEAVLVARLLDDLSKEVVVHDPKIPPLFVLTPYRAQTDAIRSKTPKELHDRVDTIDAFQGREAEVVVVSLVRSNAHEAEQASLGFLAEPERANVLLSRARRLLVIVGDLDCFIRSGSPHWQAIAEHVRSEPRFVAEPRRALGFEWPPRRSSRSSSRKRKKVKK